MTSGQEGAATQPRFNIVVVGLAAALISLLLLREFAGIIGPLFLALNLMITGYPVHRWLVRKGTPSWLSATVVSLMVFAVLVAIVVGLIWSVSEMVGLLPQYSEQFTALYQQVVDLALSWGFEPAAITNIFSSLDPTRVLFAHGAYFERDGTARLRHALEWLLQG